MSTWVPRRARRSSERWATAEAVRGVMVRYLNALDDRNAEKVYVADECRVLARLRKFYERALSTPRWPYDCSRSGRSKYQKRTSLGREVRGAMQ